MKQFQETKLARRFVVVTRYVSACREIMAPAIASQFCRNKNKNKDDIFTCLSVPLTCSSHYTFIYGSFPPSHPLVRRSSVCPVVKLYISQHPTIFLARDLKPWSGTPSSCLKIAEVTLIFRLCAQELTRGLLSGYVMVKKRVTKVEGGGWLCM